MSLFKSFKTDKNKECKGIPITYAPNDDGTVPTFYVARAAKSNKRYMKAMERNYKPYRRELQLKTIKDETAEELMLHTFIDGCLVNWANVQTEDGVSLVFNKENAKMLLTELPELYEDLNTHANDLSNYQHDVLEVDAKN